MPTSTARTSARCCSTFFYRQMYELVAGGHVYVAQPPLFRVRNKNEHLLRADRRGNARPAAGAGPGRRVLDPGDGRADRRRRRWPGSSARWPRSRKRSSPWSAAASASSCTPCGRIRHRPAADLPRLPRRPRANGSPRREELDKFVAAQEKAAGGKLNVDVGLPATAAHAQRQRRRDGRDAAKLRIVELHEVRTINTTARRPRQARLRRSTR